MAVKWNDNYFTDYIQGEMGKHGCPDGYMTIQEPSLCQKASQNLDLRYDESKNANGENALCKWCGGCIPKIVSMAIGHGAKARSICQLNGK